MAPQPISVKGGLAGGLIGLLADLTISELTGHHITTGLLELLGAGIGIFRLDRRVYQAIVNTVEQARVSDTEDYRKVAQRLDEMTLDLPELRQSILNLVEAGISAQKA